MMVAEPKTRLFERFGILAMICLLFAVIVGGAAGFLAVWWGTSFPAEAGKADAKAGRNLPDTPFTSHAKEAGIKACKDVFALLGGALTYGAAYNAQSDWSNVDPDKHAIRSLVGLHIKAPDYSGPAAGVIFATPTGSGCEGSMVRVVPFQETCQAVSSRLPVGSVMRSELAGTPVYDLANNAGQFMLLSLGGSSCVGISVTQAVNH